MNPSSKKSRVGALKALLKGVSFKKDLFLLKEVFDRPMSDREEGKAKVIRTNKK